jgi:hypothetical protein
MLNCLRLWGVKYFQESGYNYVDLMTERLLRSQEGFCFMEFDSLHLKGQLVYDVRSKRK